MPLSRTKKRVLPDRTVGDPDFEAAVVCFERKRKLVEKYLESLRLVTRHQGHLVPTVGGMLLFGKDREMIFPDSWIQCGRFIGKDKADIFDHTEIHEHLPVAVERVMEFLKTDYFFSVLGLSKVVWGRLRRDNTSYKVRGLHDNDFNFKVGDLFH